MFGRRAFSVAGPELATCDSRHVPLTVFAGTCTHFFSRFTSVHSALDHHHHHHFICPIIQQYAHLHRYNFKRAGQQGPKRTLTADLEHVIKQLLGTYSITQVKYYKQKNYRNQSFQRNF